MLYTRHVSGHLKDQQIALAPRSGKTTTHTADVGRDHPGARPVRRGTAWKVTYYATPYAQIAESAAWVLSGRPVGNPDRAANLVAEFRATAELSDAHNLFVIAIEHIAAENPPARYDLVDLSWLVHQAFEAAFPLVPTRTHETPAVCQHGVPYSDDCADCED